MAGFETRHLVQREISYCEGATNLWRTFRYNCNDENIQFSATYGFGGYPDWIYAEFYAMVSIRVDREKAYHTFKIGERGLCISCGGTLSEGLYCSNCDPEETCEDCEEHCDETYLVYSDGQSRRVCRSCYEEDYVYCDECGDYHHRDDCVFINDSYYVCEGCLEEHYEKCDECGEYYHRDDMNDAVDINGNEIRVCDGCFDDYRRCDCCDDYARYSHMSTVHDADGDEIEVCPNCRENFEECDCCGDEYHIDDLENGLCPHCAKEEEEADAV